MLGASQRVESPTPPASGLAVTIAGPERELSSDDIHRLFHGERLTRARRDRLARHPRVLIMCGTTIVGAAVYERIASELRVHEFAVDRQASCVSGDVAGALLKALDLAGLAGGDRRIVLTPRAVIYGSALRACDYNVNDEGCAGRWLQKNLPGFPSL
jgi:hypothetical protein